jgi:hypothetical protein
VDEAEEFVINWKPDNEEGTIYEVDPEQSYGPFYYEWVSGANLPAKIYWRAEQYWNKNPIIHEEE